MPRKRKSPGFDVPLVANEVPDDLPFPEQIKFSLHKTADECKRLYEETNNPLYAWQVVRMWFSHHAGPNDSKGPSFIQKGLPLPEWVHDYLLKSAGNLLDENKTKSEGISCLPGLLGFQTASSSGGGDSLFTQHHNDQKRHYVLSHLRDLLERRPDISIEKACKLTVDRLTDVDVDSLTLKKWYDKSNKSGEVYRNR